ncbi:MAG: helix-turn-helix domain-containing protein [Henriciella sp.]
MSLEHAPEREMRLALSPGEASKSIGIGLTKLYEAISSGELKSFKIGTRRLIRVSALEAWLASFEQEAG